jgi:hypothetical protein
MKYFAIVPSVLVIMLAAMAAPARADECDKLTYLTFSEPVALPGVTLPPGTYRFVHPDCATTGGLLQVSNEDGTEVYGTFLTIPEQRTALTTQSEVVFAEMPAGSPEAIKAWFYPGEMTGDGLIYPKRVAARVLNAPVQKIVTTNGPA